MDEWEGNLHKLSNEEGQTNAQRCRARGAVLLNSHHEDGQDEDGGGEHLDEEAAGDAGVGTQRGAGLELSGEESGQHPRGGHSAQELGDEDDDGTDGANGADQDQAQGDGRVKLATRDAEEQPDSDGQGETEADADVQQLGGVGCEDKVLGLRASRVDGVGAAKGEEEEEERADKLGQTGNKVVFGILGQPLGERTTLSHLDGCWCGVLAGLPRKRRVSVIVDQKRRQ